MGELWEKQAEQLDKNKERDVSVKKKTEMSIFVLLTRFIFLRQFTGLSTGLKSHLTSLG